MTIRHLKIFIQVFQAENITKAAKLLHMTQPAVTRAIQEIETYYGVCLFDRINRRLSVTESGKQFYSHALHIVESFGSLENEMKNWDEIGVLRVGSSITLGTFMLPDLITEFKKLHPQMEINVTISNGAKIQQMLCENQLDLAFVEGVISLPNLQSKKFATDKLVLITSPHHPLATADSIYLSDLLAYDLLLREPGSVGRALLDSVFTAHGLTLKPKWESVSTHALINAVHAGLGISILPQKLVKQSIDAGYVYTNVVKDESFRRNNYIVWHKNKYLTASANKLIALCEQLSDQ